jgi:hypothetical protein
MTAAFAIGQLAGPLASVGFDHLPVRRADGLGVTLWLAALGLGGSAVALCRFARISPKERNTTLDRIKPDPNRVNDPARL